MPSPIVSRDGKWRWDGQSWSKGPSGQVDEPLPEEPTQIAAWPKTNKWSLFSFIGGILAIPLILLFMYDTSGSLTVAVIGALALLASPFIVMAGHIALIQIHQRGGKGRFLAAGGTIIGYVQVFALLFVAFTVVPSLMHQVAIQAPNGKAAITGGAVNGYVYMKDTLNTFEIEVPSTWKPNTTSTTAGFEVDSPDSNSFVVIDISTGQYSTLDAAAKAVLTDIQTTPSIKIVGTVTSSTISTPAGQAVYMHRDSTLATNATVAISQDYYVFFKNGNTYLVDLVTTTPEYPTMKSNFQTMANSFKILA